MALYNFSAISLTDLDGNPVSKEEMMEVQKILATIVYTKVSDLDLVDVAFKINKCDTVDLAKSEVETLKSLWLSEDAGLSAFVKKAISDYVQDKQYPKEVINNGE